MNPQTSIIETLIGATVLGVSLLRLYDESADDSEKVADILTVATKNSVATFNDMLEAMITAKGGSFPNRNSEAVIGRRAA